jgi:hypothetical protein
MSFDVFGKNPASRTGEHFSNSAWEWRPLADYVCKTAPQITAACHYWQTNDHAGLDAGAAGSLAGLLEDEIASGRCETYAKRYASEIEMTSNVPCDFCDGTGTRKPVPQRGAGDPSKDGIPCNCCSATGWVRPYSTNYLFSTENVRSFAAFLKDCGGFEIC